MNIFSKFKVWLYEKYIIQHQLHKYGIKFCLSKRIHTDAFSLIPVRSTYYSEEDFKSLSTIMSDFGVTIIEDKNSLYYEHVDIGFIFKVDNYRDATVLIFFNELAPLYKSIIKPFKEIEKQKKEKQRAQQLAKKQKRVNLMEDYDENTFRITYKLRK